MTNLLFLIVNCYQCLIWLRSKIVKLLGSKIIEACLRGE